MVSIGHISDLHMDLSEDRRLRLIRALAHANAAGATHLIVSGDLTANGKESQFRELAGILDEYWPHSRTLLPGNHDGGMGFARTFGNIQHPTSLGQDALIIPIDTRVPRRSLAFRALGRVGPMQLSMIDTLTRNVGRPTILAMHHGPQVHPLQFFDGLVDRAPILRILGRSPLIRVLCGHDHRVLDVDGQIHVAPSVALHPDPVRVYRATPESFDVVYKSAFVGTTGFAGLPSHAP